MTGVSRSGQYTRFLGFSVLIVVVLGLIGFLPTRRLAGEVAVPAMIVGCAISLISAALAGLLTVVLGGGTPEARMQRAFAAMVGRLAVVLVLGIAAALSGLLERMPLLFWIATTYVLLLPLEVRLAVAE